VAKRLGMVAGVLIPMWLGYHFAFRQGWKQGVEYANQLHTANREEHDTMMRKIGVCSWAKVMAAQVQCQNEYKPGEE
jgi:ribulose bisphosphate carboxylase small subunit